MVNHAQILQQLSVLNSTRQAHAHQSLQTLSKLNAIRKIPRYSVLCRLSTINAQRKALLLPTRISVLNHLNSLRVKNYNIRAYKRMCPPVDLF